jgi:3-deoxy-manno-octulosonate cytidylyltransferase (CMP-KDO synthetase)|tara:strand:- start:832 stop:1029 length:198 start_codon:yes stop_codon:yes gene_type:complete
MLDYLIVIPARLKSSRFPGKPLEKINGKELVLHVLERCNLIFDKKKIKMVKTSKETVAVDYPKNI